jgi:hypothetical protein
LRKLNIVIFGLPIGLTGDRSQGHRDRHRQGGGIFFRGCDEHGFRSEGVEGSRGGRFTTRTSRSSLLVGRTVEACCDYTADCIQNVTFHPLLAAAHFAFSKHRPIVLSPDMIWVTILQGLARHVNDHAERLRNRFVAHQGTFDPHRPESAGRDSWTLTVYPDDNYAIFLAPAFRFGVFANPLEQAPCIFERELLEAMGNGLPVVLGNLVRKDGNGISG